MTLTEEQRKAFFAQQKTKGVTNKFDDEINEARMIVRSEPDVPNEPRLTPRTRDLVSNKMFKILSEATDLYVENLDYNELKTELDTKMRLTNLSFRDVDPDYDEDRIYTSISLGEDFRVKENLQKNIGLDPTTQPPENIDWYLGAGNLLTTERPRMFEEFDEQLVKKLTEGIKKKMGSNYFAVNTEDLGAENGKILIVKRWE